MTDKARIVLQDAKHAIGKHNKKLQAESFRTSWITIVTLLRAIGHVLDKVDSKKSLELKDAIDTKYSNLKKSKPEPLIFLEFIHKERNRFLKNYEHGISRTLRVPSLIKGVWVVSDGANMRGGAFCPGTEYESMIASGAYEGRYEKEVALEAHNWWRTYLDEVDELTESNKRLT